MAPSQNDPVLDAPPPASDQLDPLAELRRAAAAPSPPWPERLRAALDVLRGVSARGGDRRRAVVLASVVALLGVAALGAWWVGVDLPGPRPGDDAAASLPRAGTSVAPAGATSTSAEPASTTGTGAAGDLIVQAAGAVVRPGVYHLAAGARVGDLIALAGGLTADADADRVNLASPLADGVRVWVPRRGEADPPVAIGGGASGGAGGSGGTGGSGPPALVDLNTATAEELDALPGIGPATAAAIIDHRQRNGPFRSVDDLADVRGIGQAKLAQLRELVRV